MTDMILFLRGFELAVSIGIYEQERAAPQPLRIDVALAITRPADDDAIDATLDYDFLRTEITALAAARHYDLQETLCAAILALCRAQAGVTGALARTAKTSIYPDAESVGCQQMWLADGVRPLVGPQLCAVI